MTFRSSAFCNASLSMSELRTAGFGINAHSSPRLHITRRSSLGYVLEAQHSRHGAKERSMRGSYRASWHLYVKSVAADKFLRLRCPYQ